MKIININGPINSGKSTISKLLVKVLPQSLFVEVDDLLSDKEQIVLGLTREQGWKERTNRLANLINSEKGANQYEYIVFAYPMTDNLYREWKGLEDENTKFIAITLSPSLDVCLKNRGTRELDEWEVARIAQMYQEGYQNPQFADFVIDNSSQSPEETLQDVINFLTKNFSMKATFDFGVYGDSIAFGYGNQNQSWFDILYGAKNAVKLAQNGAKIDDVLAKICHDVNNYQTLFLAVGINDLLQSDMREAAIKIEGLIAKYAKILQMCKQRADRIVVQSVLPVREELFPNQNWLDSPMWAYNDDVINFNKKLAELCWAEHVEFADFYTEMVSRDLAIFYTDAVHLNALGQQLLVEFYCKL